MIDLRADCAACDGLCCVAPAFDAGAMFAFDKPAATACRHLDGTSRCRIHPRLQQEGMQGCARYDCRGAGQRTMALFPGQSWRDGPEAARAIFGAFADLRPVHEVLELLASARALPLPEAAEAGRQARIAALSQDRPAPELAGDVAEARAFLRSLAPVLTSAGAGGTDAA